MISFDDSLGHLDINLVVEDFIAVTHGQPGRVSTATIDDYLE